MRNRKKILGGKEIEKGYFIINVYLYDVWYGYGKGKLGALL